MGEGLYSFLNTLFFFGGDQITGFDEGDDAIKVTPNQDRLTTKVGADGDGIGSLSANRGAEIELKLLTNSPSNAILNDAFDTMEKHFVVPDSSIRFVDLAGGNIARSRKSYVKAKPEFVYGTVSQVFLWKISIIKGTYDITGGG